MFHLTGAEGTVIAGGLTAVSYFVLAHRQRGPNSAATESRDLLKSLQRQVSDLSSALSAHTTDDAANFRELRQGLKPPKRRGWLLPALALVVKLFL